MKFRMPSHDGEYDKFLLKFKEESALDICYTKRTHLRQTRVS